MKLSGSQIIIECLKKEGVEFIFGYPGGAGIIHPDLAFLHTAESLANLRVARADCFYFSTLKYNTCLKAITHKIIVVGFTITDLALVIRRLFFSAHFSSFPLFGKRRGHALN